jgi:hypothetical protein
MHVTNTANQLIERVSEVLTRFTEWLDVYDEISWDHQSFFAGHLGGRVKSLYYRRPILGTAAVAPMIFFEAFFPAARRLFHRRMKYQFMFVASRSFSGIGSDAGSSHQRNLERLDQAAWFVPLPAAAFRLGQCPHAPLGAVSNVSQFGLLSPPKKAPI